MNSSTEYVVSQTDGIIVSACPVLMEDTEAVHWGYYFCIENNSDHKIQLLGKDWKVTDEYGRLYSDTSAGFKGELPELEPGEYYEFTSEMLLDSPHAVFYGSCRILSGGCARDIKIPTFNLSAEGQDHPTRVLN